MDETPIYFDLVPGRTVDRRGNKSICVWMAASDKWHPMVVLTVTASGRMLPPMIIFKGKRELKIEHPAGWLICVQPKGWMDEELMLRWIKDILLPYTKKECTMLLLDAFSGHKTEAVRKVLWRGNVLPAMIPGGCTSKLQPFDISLICSVKYTVETALTTPWIRRLPVIIMRRYFLPPTQFTINLDWIKRLPVLQDKWLPIRFSDCFVRLWDAPKKIYPQVIFVILRDVICDEIQFVYKTWRLK